ncbi:MAG: type II 3-dehydroquinate dehydratase [Candidatus Caldatribacteriota bacterium]
MLKIGIINGPNLNMLGKRDKNIYGDLTLEEINQKIMDFAKEEDMEVIIKQSNSEGDIIDTIQHLSNQVDGLIINPGAYTHYSYAIADALRDCPIPTIEVHLSNIYSRESFRRKSVTAPACTEQIAGFGYKSYLIALYALKDLISNNQKTVS